MNYDYEWLQQTLENRSTAVRETIRAVTLQELKELGLQRFPSATDPWCERYNAFLSENPNAKFYRAETPEGADVVYCRTTEQAVWFMDGKGMGIVQPKGLALLAAIVDAL